MKAILSFLVAIQLLIFSPIQAQQVRQAGELNDKQCELLLPDRIGSEQAVSIGFLAETTLLQAGESVNLVIRNANDEVVVNKAITMQPETVSSLLSGLAKGVAIQTEGNYSVSIIGSQGQVLDVKDLLVKNGRATKKPLFEEFTSSTCGPCYAANLIFNQTMEANPGTHSLIKYQMNWPGAGDPYYTLEGGARRTYYGVSGVPDLFINGTLNVPPIAISQAVYNDFIGLPADMDIFITQANINDDHIVTVSVSLESDIAIAAGAKLHIAVIEKLTTGNVGNNGETEFHNVMLKMLPNSNGTTLPALNPGTPFTLTESYDMDLTFMEEDHDLAVVAFVQKANKEVLQSEMADVDAGNVEKFNVTFNVKDSDGVVVEGALVTVPGVGIKATGPNGTAVFQNLIANTYDYKVTASGLLPVEASFTVVNSDLTVQVELEIPPYYFYEDFTDAANFDIPADWFRIMTSPDNVYTYQGVVTFVRQNQANNPILLVSPLIDLAPAGQLMFDIGGIQNNPELKLGTIADPTDPSTFVELFSFFPGVEMETVTVDVADINGGQGEVHLAWSHVTNVSMSYFSFDNVRMTRKDKTEFDVTFNVKDADGAAIEGALVTVTGHGVKTTGADGKVVFLNLEPETYYYKVTASGLTSVESTFTVYDSDMTINVTLEPSDYYFFEDFNGAANYEVPADWFRIMSGTDMVYTYQGVITLFKQSAGNDPLMLVSPLIDLAPAGELMFDVGAASFNPGLKFGTMTDPSDASTFVELYTYTPGTVMETITIDVADINGGQGEVHLAWGHGAENNMSYVSLDNVKMTWNDAPATYNVAFNVTNSSGTAIPGALVSLEGFDNQSTNSSGNTVFTEVDPGTYSYTVFASGYSSVTGEVTVIDGNITESVVLPSTSYYFYEDFDEGIPSDWTVHVTSPDFLMPSEGTVLFFRQANTADNPILLISPMIDMTPAGELMFNYGERFDNPVLAFGTVTNPNDPSTFEIIETYDPGSSWNTATIDVSEINGGQGDTYLAWAMTNAGFSYFYFDEVILTFGDASPSFFFDDFDSYTAGEQLACQNPEAWTTWSNAPCSDEDAWVSDDVSYSGSNSVKVINDVDLVKVLDNHTEGLFNISFKLYIPSGNYAYFNSLQVFNGSSSEWGFEGYFPPGGTANISAGGANAATYSFSYDTWLDIRLQVDLNANWAEYYYNNNLIHGWQWSLGANGSGNLNQLGGIDFYGWTESGGTALFYFDDFRIELATPLTPPSNFTAEVINDSDVLLSWDAPAGPVIAYNVYRDNVIIAQEITETSYTDVGLFPGSYMFDVKAIYDEGLSGGAGPLEVIIPGGTDRNFVVLEIATGTWCVYCPGAAMGADDLVENGHDVVVIEYHSGDVYENNDSKARIDYYDVEGYPTSVFDGTSKKSGGNANTSIYPTYLEYYNTHIEKVAYFEIEAKVESVSTSATAWKLKVDAEMVYEFESDNLVLHAALTESHIPQTWFNQTEVNFVCRTMIPNSDGTALDFSSSNIQSVEIEFDIPAEYVMPNLEMVVFIQDKVTGAIHQAQKADFMVGIDEEMQESSWIYPNPANDKVQISTNDKKSEITIYDIHGRLLDSFMLDGIEKTLDISAYKPGLYLFKLSNTDGIRTEKILVK